MPPKAKPGQTHRRKARRSIDSAPQPDKQLTRLTHPKGGGDTQSWCGAPAAARQACGAASNTLLKAGEAWHLRSLDATEQGLWQAGDPVELPLAARKPEQAAAVQ
jgi:hypothetical protein